MKQAIVKFEEERAILIKKYHPEEEKKVENFQRQIEEYREKLTFAKEEAKREVDLLKFELDQNQKLI